VFEYWESRIRHLRLCYLHCRQHKLVATVAIIVAVYAFVAEIVPFVEMPAFMVAWKLPKVPLAWAAVALLAVALFIVIEGSYRLRGSIDAFVNPTWETVAGHNYTNEAIHVDGKRFVDCKFHNAKFVFRGKAPVDLRGNNEFGGSIRLETDNPAITHYLTVESKLVSLPGSQYSRAALDRNGNEIPDALKLRASAVASSPREQLERAKEAVLVEDALGWSDDELRLNIGHDGELRAKFEAVPLGRYEDFDARRDSLLRCPIIAAKFLRAHLLPRSPFAGMVKEIFSARGKSNYETTSDFLFEIHAVNVTNTATTISSINAEAEIDGKWIRLERIDDLSDYEKVFDRAGSEGRGGKIFNVNDERIEQLPSFWERIKNAHFSKGIGYQGWVRFELITTSDRLDNKVLHKVRLVDSLGGIHPAISVGPHSDDGEIRHSAKTYDP
jgi:hypothetical protein